MKNWCQLDIETISTLNRTWFFWTNLTVKWKYSTWSYPVQPESNVFGNLIQSATKIAHPCWDSDQGTAHTQTSVARPRVCLKERELEVGSCVTALAWIHSKSRPWAATVTLADLLQLSSKRMGSSQEKRKYKERGGWKKKTIWGLINTGQESTVKRAGTVIDLALTSGQCFLVFVTYAVILCCRPPMRRVLMSIPRIGQHLLRMDGWIDR